MAVEKMRESLVNATSHSAVGETDGCSLPDVLSLGKDDGIEIHDSERVSGKKLVVLKLFNAR